MKKPTSSPQNRRAFLKQSSLGASMMMLGPLQPAAPASPQELVDATLHPLSEVITQKSFVPTEERRLDLSPARWIWYPSQRVLQNTMVLFRRTLSLPSKPVSATGWILGDSRYLLWVNGERVQWGPAPSDPRWSEADPLDLTAMLRAGKNTLGAQVLYFGVGDGTWPIGKAGFIFMLEVTFSDGTTQTFTSDATWQAFLTRSWRPGQFKRWYLRAFQEEFDARLYPEGWTTSDYEPDRRWLPAMDLGGRADLPAICTQGRDYLYDSEGDSSISQLRRRQVPMLNEPLVSEATLTESTWIDWKRPVVDYFESLTPDAFEVDRTPAVTEIERGTWRIVAERERGTALTFAFEEQVVGWPFFTITAPEGTVVELMVQEGHEVDGPPLLNTRFNSWTRFLCKEGKNRFETFDFESLRWLQLHIHDTQDEIIIEDVGVRRRMYPWPHQPSFSCSDPVIQNVWDAAVNTLHNCAQDTIVDCMGRERQQYSGDIGHVLHTLFYTFGETRLPARYVDTFSQGLTNTGFYLDSWPAYDRLARLPERELQLTRWGPLVDHGVGHTFDAFYYYLYTGDLEALAEVYPRLLRFAAFLDTIRDEHGLLKVEDLGTPAVWIDHDAYEQQRHKQCAFNLYAVAMLQEALAPLCLAHGDEHAARWVRAFGEALHRATITRFWSEEAGAFVVNLPWLEEDDEVRFCDRSLSTAIMFGLNPKQNDQESIRLLAETPENMGFSYPANAGWRLWGLAAGGRGDVVVEELRSRWGPMRSIHLNNTLSENWEPRDDTSDQWSHAPVAPLYLLYMGLAGIHPIAPGFARYSIRPQPGDLARLTLTAQTVKGPIGFSSEGQMGDRTLVLNLPADAEGVLVLDERENIALPQMEGQAPSGLRHFVLPSGGEVSLNLKFT